MLNSHFDKNIITNERNGTGVIRVKAKTNDSIKKAKNTIESYGVSLNQCKEYKFNLF